MYIRTEKIVVTSLGTHMTGTLLDDNSTNNLL
jgi:hypothetical protein